MWCSTKAPSVPTGGRGEDAPDVRVGDEDRQRTADLLARAAGTGHLALHQVDERMAGAWSARSALDLTVLEADLPASLRDERDRREAAERQRDAARAGLHGQLVSYLVVMAVLVAVWVVAGLTGGGWYPWPVWPALGWGVAVAGQARTARAPVR